MSFDFLQEAFKKLDCLSEDTFSMSNDGIKDLSELDTKDKLDAEADVTEIIDVDADTENDIKDSYTGKVVMECPVCHSFVFAEKDEIELDKKTELANPTQECPYCCELGGFNIIGQIAEYNIDEEDVEEPEEVDETEDETTIPEEEVEEESVDDEEDTSVNEALSPEDEEFRKASLLVSKYDAMLDRVVPKTKLGAWFNTLQDKIDAKHDAKKEDELSLVVVVTSNDGEYTAEEIEENKKILADFKRELKKLDLLCLEDKLSDKSREEVVITIYRKNADVSDVKGFNGTSPIPTKELKEELDCHVEDCDCPDSEFESCVKKAIKEQFSDDAWTSFEYDDELDTPVVEVFNGEQKLGEYYLVDEKLVSALSESLTVDSDGNTINVGGADEIEVTTDDGLKVTIENTAESVDELEAEDETEATESDDEISPDEPAEVESSEEHADTDTEDDAEDEPKENAEDETKEGEEVISELTDEDKEEIKNGEAEEQNEDLEKMKEHSSVDVKLEEIDESAFNDLCESFLKKTYANVESFNICDAYTDDNSKIVLEGVINFKSGNSKNTCFKFESKDITKSGKARFIGENLQLSKAKKAFTISGNICDGKFITESLNYNYGVKDRDGKMSRVYGTINRK